MLLPEAVAPTSATVRPGSTVKVTPVEQRLVRRVAVGEARRRRARRRARRAGRVASPYCISPVACEHRAHPAEADHAARELAEQPADRPDRERDDGEQVGDGDHVAGVGGAAQHPRDADAEHDEDAEVGQRGEGRVERRPDPAGPDVDVAQLVGLGGEPLGLLGLAAEGLDHHRAVEGLVRDLADLGAQLLGPGGPALGEPLVDDVGHDHQREHQQPDQRQHEVGEQHLHDRDHHHRDRADRHRQRRDRPPRGLDVGVGVGEQLAGRVPLVPLHREGEVLPGDGAAGAGLHAVLHDAGPEPAGDDADRAQDRDAEEERQHRDQQLGARSRRRGTPGSTTWSVDQPSTQASATVSAPNSSARAWRG